MLSLAPPPPTSPPLPFLEEDNDTGKSPGFSLALPFAIAVAYANKSAGPNRRATPVEHPSAFGLMHNPDGAGPTAAMSSSQATSAAVAPPPPGGGAFEMATRRADGTTRLRAENTPEDAREARTAPVAALSMQSREASAPDPVNATPAAVRNACIAPFSPHPPCMAMNTTAPSAAARAAIVARVSPQAVTPIAVADPAASSRPPTPPTSWSPPIFSSRFLTDPQD
mmetsp:Transcript_27556/g.67751  ORF Transcript_27556/g.67751 Transcript_27556/m.67751 type:complete len:225 (-) Transcript_27556:1729-2403(-)